MSDWAQASIWIVLFLAVLIYQLYKLKYSKDPKEELLKAKELLDQGLIEQGDYEILKSKLVKRIVTD